jgi:glucosamine--fructose-6-phosphate aminotransferase (isomerizing)
MEREIRSQPAELERLSAQSGGVAREIAAEIQRFKPRFVMVAARGTSDRAAIYAKYLFEIELGMPVALAAPSVVSLYRRTLDVKGALVIGISQSGQSPDVVGVVESGQRSGALTLAITNDPQSPLAKAADRVFDLGVGQEKSVAATKTFTAQLFALWLLAAALKPGQPPAIDIARVTADAIAGAERAWTAESLGDGDRQVIVVGRGYSFPSALEIALKLREVGMRQAEGFSSADLLHGPIAPVGSTTTALIVGAEGPALESLIQLADDLKARGARLLAITDSAGLAGRARQAVLLDRSPEPISPIPFTVAGQWLALSDALGRGLDPDQPRGLSKVTRTH